MSTLDEIVSSIKRARARSGGKPPPHCYVCDQEWDEVASELIGGPWFGELTVMGVPLLRLRDIPH